MTLLCIPIFAKRCNIKCWKKFNYGRDSKSRKLSKKLTIFIDKISLILFLTAQMDFEEKSIFGTQVLTPEP
jgi:hypothetical protein